jgi:uncharacterized protein
MPAPSNRANPSSPASPPAPAAGPRTVACPNCRQPAVYAAGNPFRPFCSARCQGQDFGAWATEAYRVDAQPPQDEPS